MKSEEESESEADGIDFINPQFNGTKNSIDLYGKIKKFKGILKQSSYVEPNFKKHFVKLSKYKDTTDSLSFKAKDYLGSIKVGSGS